MNMPGMNVGNPGMGGIPMANNMPNGALPKQEEVLEAEQKLNNWIYGYFLQREQWDLARYLKNSNLVFSPALANNEDEMNGVTEDSKSGISDKKPADLPIAKSALDENGGSLLQGWFALFWDMFSAQRHRSDASKNANHLVEQNKVSGFLVPGISAKIIESYTDKTESKCIGRWQE